MSSKKTLIYLADLTHTGPVISSNIHPLGIGLIGAQLLHEIGPDNLEVELFKYPDDLSAALERRTPDVFGLANYSWNWNLGYAFAKRVKAKHPEVTLIGGGPNYGLTDLEMEAFWKRYPLLDFYIVREGEKPMVGLMQRLMEVDFDLEQAKSDESRLGSCHFMRAGELVKVPDLPRVKSLEELESPYLTGLMDKFFNNELNPMIHTTRGCPFSCTFCSEGAKYYQKVANRSVIREELEYIAKRIGSVVDLYISDANFGMFPGDVQKAEILADMQENHDWPKRIYVSTGKNQKERVVKIASILNGALNVAASLQSTDEKILENVARSNISLESLGGIADSASRANANTYTELILGLPGDNVVSHEKSLKDTVDIGMGLVRMYQLILLPQTELSTPESREKHEMVTKFRLMPRSYGKYNVYGEDFVAVESEEICIANATMNFEEYLDCRELDLTVELINNGNLFQELMYMCQWLGHSWFDLLLAYHNRRKEIPELKKLYQDFRDENVEGLWDTAEELERDVVRDLDEFIRRDDGSNEMSKAKAIGTFHLLEELHELLFQELEKVVDQKGLLDERMREYLAQLKQYSMLRKKEMLESDRVIEQPFQFDFKSLMKDGFKADPRDYYLPEPQNFVYYHTDEQKKMISSYTTQYGTTLDGLGRICMRTQLVRLYRTVDQNGDEIDNYSHTRKTSMPATPYIK